MSSIPENGSQSSEVGRRTKVMQVVDTLDMGGAEKVAVSLANMLPRDRFQSYLCVTRRTGPLMASVEDHVTTLFLNRKGRFDVAAIRRLISFAIQEGVQVFHAHGSSLFISRMAANFNRSVAVVWHDHYGKGPPDARQARLYRLATRGTGVVSVNHELLDWARSELHIPDDRLWYVPNWVEPLAKQGGVATLPGTAGRRLVCVANFRAQKDHLTLLRALAQVKTIVPDVHLLLAGDSTEPHYAQYIRTQIGLLKLADNVTCLGPRQDVGSILEASDIGVLSSASEGLPLALLEYARAGLPVVATNVGQCGEVLDAGRVGFLVPRASPEPMADALIRLLNSPELRVSRGAAFQEYVAQHYSPASALKQLTQIYQTMLA